MKVVIFCGGLGVRMGEETQRIPKPMIRIGNRPILWHIMRYYAAWGHNEFVLCLGYKGDVIKEYFLDHNEALYSDFVLDGRGAEAGSRSSSGNGDWRITFADTGMTSTIGERLKAVERYLDDDDDVPGDLRRRPDGRSARPDGRSRSEQSGKLIQFLSVRPQFNAHIVVLTDERRHRHRGRGLSTSDVRINGGFFVCRREILDEIEPGDELVEETFARLIPRGEVVAYPTTGSSARWTRSRTGSDSRRCYESGSAPWRMVGVEHAGRRGSA